MGDYIDGLKYVYFWFSAEESAAAALPKGTCQIVILLFWKGNFIYETLTWVILSLGWDTIQWLFLLQNLYYGIANLSFH